MHPFRLAVEQGDVETAVDLLADDVRFHSPVVFRQYTGRDQVAPLLRAVAEVFQDFRYVREYGVEDGVDHALLFSARVGDRELEGCDFLHLDEQGRIEDFTVMVRPLSAAIALAEAMSRKLRGQSDPAER